MNTWVIACLGLTLGRPASAREIPAMQFLLLQRSVRSIGMAESGTALADDAGALFVNPSGIAFFSATHLQAGTVNMGNQLPALNEVLLIYPDPDFRNAWGITWGAFRAASQGYDIFGNPTSEASDVSFSAGLSHAIRFGENWAFGATGKFASERLNPEGLNGLPKHTGRATAFDLGALRVSETDRVRFGATLYNVGADARFSANGRSKRDYALPSGLRLGAALRFLESKNLNLAGDLDLPRYASATSIRLGSEYWWSGHFGGRTGVKIQKRSESLAGVIPTVGVSLAAGRLVFDAASAIDFAGLGTTLDVALSWRFNSKTGVGARKAALER